MPTNPSLRVSATTVPEIPNRDAQWPAPAAVIKMTAESISGAFSPMREPIPLSTLATDITARITLRTFLPSADGDVRLNNSQMTAIKHALEHPNDTNSPEALVNSQSSDWRLYDVLKTARVLRAQIWNGLVDESEQQDLGFLRRCKQLWVTRPTEDNVDCTRDLERGEELYEGERMGLERVVKAVVKEVTRECELVAVTTPGGGDVDVERVWMVKLRLVVPHSSKALNRLMINESFIVPQIGQSAYVNAPNLLDFDEQKSGT
ncbi:hypothetical protein JR316_0003037 [Psilocybe cubensis]|uniref:Uncharacterized protein n=2 Tax=Psilocybe cubensis TaxID=181762 RepID=A0ACB8H7D9_PSICU|nr:hypothetical protein JR316_0003037 [Psilocybe cubensis]KAH9483567.1 hypothetical protein JR316_0003037 [Psilocybe cubensis]